MTSSAEPTPRAAPLLAQVVQLAPGRPAALLGARAALATALPLALMPWIGEWAATWASAAGFTVALADKGGSYISRARTMGAVTLGGALAVTLAGLAGANTIAAVLAMFVVASCGAFLGVFGPATGAAGTAVSVLFAIALPIPHVTTHAIAVRALTILLTGFGTMLLALVFWPVRVYKPARYAIARSLRLLATHSRDLNRLADEPGSRGWIEQVARNHSATRESIEFARAVLVATRRGRAGESGRGARLLTLVQLADVLFARFLQLEELFESAVRAGVPAATRDAMRATFASIADSLDDLAGGAEREGPAGAAPAIPWGPESLRESMRSHAPGGETAGLHVEHTASMLDRMRDEVRVGYETVGSLFDERPAASPYDAPLVLDEKRSLVEIVRENLAPDAMFARHAVRVGVTASLAVALVHAFGLTRGYWVTLTVLIVLQPSTPATLTRMLQRIAGTVAGGLVAALLASTVHDPIALLALVTVLAGVSAAVVQLNYALFSFFITPTFVLLAEAHAFDPQVARLRVVNTLLGGIAAFVGARLFWPHDERKHFPQAMADVLRALRSYFDEMIAVVESAAPLPSARLRNARRRFGLATNRADVSFQRLLAESGHEAHRLEPFMTTLLFSRRAAATVSAAGSARWVDHSDVHALATSDFVASVRAVLDDLADAVATDRSPSPLPPLDENASQTKPATLAVRFARLAEQLEVIHGAIARRSEGRSHTTSA